MIEIYEEEFIKEIMWAETIKTDADDEHAMSIEIAQQMVAQILGWA